MRFALVTLAMLVLGAFAASPSIAQVTDPAQPAQPAQNDRGLVIALWVSFGQFEVQVLTPVENLTFTVPEETWKQLDVGDTMIHDADGWHLLYKGPEREGE